MAWARPSKSLYEGWMTPTWRSGIAAVDASSRAIFRRTERARKKALMAAQTTTIAISSTQPRGLNQSRIATTKARAIVMRMKNEKKRPRVTSCLYAEAATAFGISKR